MKTYYVFHGGEIHRVLWDGVAPWNPPQGAVVMTEAEAQAWRTANPKPTVNEATHKVMLVGTAWQTVPLSSEELAAKADGAERQALEAAIAIFDARTASSAQVQRAIAFLLRRLL